VSRTDVVPSVRVAGIACLWAVSIACSSASSVETIEFLTSGQCVTTPLMRKQLDAALVALHRPTDYTVTDLDTLPASDVRHGYPTPTVLYGGDDLFGFPRPTAPLETPT
jgi:hypothetical protein